MTAIANLNLEQVSGNKGRLLRALETRFIEFIEVVNLVEATQFSIHDDLEANAYAIHSQVDHEVAMTYGALATYSNLMYALACDAQLFTEQQGASYVQPSNIEEIRTYCRLLLDVDNPENSVCELVDHPLDDSWVRYFPRDMQRKKIALGLTDTALEFLLLHEFGHVCKGHVGYQRGEALRHIMPEAPMKIVKIPKPIRQVMEWDADTVAARWLAYLLHRNKMLLHDVSLTFPDPFNRMTSILFGIILTFRAFPGWGASVEILDKSGYPHPKLRLEKFVRYIYGDLVRLNNSIINLALQRAYDMASRLEDILGVEICPSSDLSESDIQDAIVDLNRRCSEYRDLFKPYELKFRLSDETRLP
jgi:hypothetical protein